MNSVFSLFGWRCFCGENKTLYIRLFVEKKQSLPFKINLSINLGITSSSAAHHGTETSVLPCSFLVPNWFDEYEPAEAPMLVNIWRTISPISELSQDFHLKGKR